MYVSQWLLIVWSEGECASVPAADPNIVTAEANSYGAVAIVVLCTPLRNQPCFSDAFPTGWKSLVVFYDFGGT